MSKELWMIAAGVALFMYLNQKQARAREQAENSLSAVMASRL